MHYWGASSLGAHNCPTDYHSNTEEEGDSVRTKIPIVMASIPSIADAYSML
jgi:hypothetical protein